MHNPLVCKDDMRIHQKHVWDWNKKRGERPKRVLDNKKTRCILQRELEKRERERRGWTTTTSEKISA